MSNRQTLLEQYQQARPVIHQQFRGFVSNGWLFRFFMLQKLPMGLIAGLRVRELTDEKCVVTVPYRWLNTNPFKSTYFAVSAMAGEMAGGLMGVMYTHKARPSVALLVTQLRAEFSKKATGLSTFTCTDGALIRAAIEQTILSGEGTTAETTSIGRNAAGEEECRFIVTWSFKARE